MFMIRRRLSLAPSLARLCAGLAIAGLLAAAAVAPERAPETWVTYANSRFGTAITYPADGFTPNPAPANNDGRSFTDTVGGGD